MIRHLPRTIVTALALTGALAACSADNRPVGRSAAPPASEYDLTAAREIISTSNEPAKQLFGHKSTASSQTPASWGFYSKGCLAGGAQLPETGPTWQAMRLSRNRNWGHPELIDYVKTLSAKAARQPGWAGLYVGDMSQPRGGPMLTGHASHQIGLDADIWMLPPSRLDLSRTERENLSSISTRRANGAYTNSNWTPQHHQVLKAAASDPRVARIFIFPGAKVKMCNDETGDKSWLRKVRPWYGHHYHFHVRLNCPPGLSGCTNQDPPPPGDGCEDAQQWVNNILNPPPPDPNAPAPQPRREIRLADLPQQCAAVLQSQ
ncbi:penicillin-insensitive murein endopeptidase [Maritimibacter sp. UBA3975]|uniref:penicillin-insensitive murein endopeptidase n=1 Tax=Maritimibacter sp. UBA3975 TaxID=1946833 RepID=UPI000C09694A|nr:penicillin-insensitive murein endopeptidase [Maritimibacter sp. UBA3975]MAM63670.1 penicillin-insensitive murein endopeptidase [Maritimibacter sp.]|tara:strand:- start:10650 stop:11606 length:957 start_codon:yes stop_codon:yes gene_type:complete